VGGVELMADTKVLTDEEVLEALDFEHKEGCDAHDCPMAATFVIICRGCSFSNLVCTTHYLQVKAICDAPGLCICFRCRRTAKNLAALCQVIPIGGRP
jgi:hypothetical protein